MKKRLSSNEDGVDEGKASKSERPKIGRLKIAVSNEEVPPQDDFTQTADPRAKPFGGK